MSGKGPSDLWQQKTSWQDKEPPGKPNEKPPAKGNQGRYVIGLHPGVLKPDGGSPEDGNITKLGWAFSSIVSLWPCMPKWGNSEGEERGLQLLELDRSTGKSQYKKVLENLGLSKDYSNINPINIAFLMDSAIGESWSNTFGASRFEQMANFASPGIQDLRSVTGAKDLEEAIRVLSNSIGGKVGDVGNQFANAAGTAQDFIRGAFGQLGSSAIQLFAGSRIDFPAVWQMSNFSPSYQLTVRLYNPNPKDPAAYEEHIIIPTAMILALALPLSDSKYTFSFPLLVKAVAPGMFKIDAGYISDVQIIKGGESQDFTFQQQPGMIDIRFTISSLYETMTATTDPEHEDETKIERPTLKKYITNLKDWLNYDYPFGEKTEASSETDGALDDASMSNTSNMISNATDFFNPLGRVSGDIGSLFDSLIDGLSELTDFLGSSLAGISDFINDITDIFDSLSTGVQEITNPIDFLINDVSDIIDSMGGFGDILDIFSNSSDNVPQQPSSEIDILMANLLILLNGLGTIFTIQDEINILNITGNIEESLVYDVLTTEEQLDLIEQGLV